MKKLFFCVILSIVSIVSISAAENSDKVMRKESDGTYIVNTTTLCNAKGFKGTTPVEVYIKKGIVTKVSPLSNGESPNYFLKVMKFLVPEFKNLKIKEAKKKVSEKIPDGCTGATLSTRAVQDNIKVALEYYEKHK